MANNEANAFQQISAAEGQAAPMLRKLREFEQQKQQLEVGGGRLHWLLPGVGAASEQQQREEGAQ